MAKRRKQKYYLERLTPEELDHCIEELNRRTSHIFMQDELSQAIEELKAQKRAEFSRRATLLAAYEREAQRRARRVARKLSKTWGE